MYSIYRSMSTKDYCMQVFSGFLKIITPNFDFTVYITTHVFNIPVLSSYETRIISKSISII